MPHLLIAERFELPPAANKTEPLRSSHGFRSGLTAGIIPLQIPAQVAKTTGDQAMSNKEDVPGVIVFPPLIPLVVLVVGILLDWLVPLGFLAAVPLSVRVVAGLAG